MHRGAAHRPQWPVPPRRSSPGESSAPVPIARVDPLAFDCTRLEEAV
jgi:hypothetical protein